ncbi:hypothetical protein G9A89_002514 [Geosiphon pyriformis]|nr:hypothetical protein G9A89_002514 [Geosiphon pyriformis]
MESWPASDNSRSSSMRKSIRNLKRSTKHFIKNGSFENLQRKYEEDYFQSPLPLIPPLSFSKSVVNPSHPITRHSKNSKSSFSSTSSTSSISSCYSNQSTPRQKPFHSRSFSSQSEIPRLHDLKVFYNGYPKYDLIIDAAAMVLKIETGQWVSDNERYIMRSQLGVEICKFCPPGTLEFLSWQVLVDFWKRIPNSN